MRLLRSRLRLVGSLLAVATVTVAVIAIASGGPSAKSAKAAPAVVACAAGTDVQTTNGPICGITVGTVNEWLGIPYAAPPVGALRWQPPQAPTPWTTTLQATAFGSACQSPSNAGERSLPVRERVEAGGLVDQPAGDGPHPRRRVLRRVGERRQHLAGYDRA